MSRIFITIGSAYSKAANVNPVDGIWCSDCGWAGRVEEDMTDSEESEEPLFEEFSEYVDRLSLSDRKDRQGRGERWKRNVFLSR